MRDLWLVLQGPSACGVLACLDVPSERPTGGGSHTPGGLVVPAARPTLQRGSQSRPTDSPDGAPDPKPGR